MKQITFTALLISLTLALSAQPSSATISKDAPRNLQEPGNQKSLSNQNSPRNLNEWGSWNEWGSQADGRYLNPILPEDYSDIDCIQVGKDYYAISSTFQFSPGMIILHSRNLVDWTICGHAVDDLTQIGPELNWDRMNRYGRGIWAGSIRYRDGVFYIVFGTPDEGFFMTTATDPAGLWTPLVCLLPEAGWDDCCIAWDTDGTPYLVGTCFKDNYKTYLIPINRNMDKLLMDKAILVNEGNRREANKILIHKGWYYLVFSEHIPEFGRYVVAKRSRNLTGPYTEEKQLTRNLKGDHEPNQGGLIVGPDRRWYCFTHHGTGDWSGRVASLLPVTWKRGWPIIGKVGKGSVGEMVWSGKMPAAANSPAATQSKSAASAAKGDSRFESFDDGTLSHRMEWNYQPRADKFSLTERPGWLRLKSFAPIHEGKLLTFGNILTERVLRSPDCVVETKIDLSALKDGDRCGLCHFSKSSSSLGVIKEQGRLYLEFSKDEKWTRVKPLASSQLWLRSSWGLDGVAEYSYSTDGINFSTYPETYTMQWAHYRGDRIGIFCSGRTDGGGHADFDYVNFCY